MSLRAVEQLTTGDTADYPAGYDATKWNLGPQIRQYTGALATDKYIGPIKPALAIPVDESTGIPPGMIDSVQWSDSIVWLFGIESVVGATKRITAYSYNKTTSVYSWKGFITFSVTNATNVQRGFRMTYYTHTTGTVAVSGTAVTGTSTQFQTQRIAVGARIGFGTTDPTAVTTWYYISAIGSNTGATLTLSAGTITAGTSYVIEELRPVLTLTNTTTTNGGLFVGKGITWDDFITTGTTIAASASTVDNLKLTYWLADAGTVTNITACGITVDGNAQLNFSGLTHYAYVLDGTASVKIYKYNLRAAGTITTGKMTLTGSDIVITGAQAVTGTNSQTNNGIICTAAHGPGSGIKSIYFVTTTRLYRAAESNITAGNTTWQSENRVEVPPGGGTVQTATSALTFINYSSSVDRFYITSTGATSFRNYLTQYPTTSGDEFEFAFGNAFVQLDNAAADSDSVPLPYDTRNAALYVETGSGIAHMLRVGSSTTGTLGIQAISMVAHWDFTAITNNVAISPEIFTPNNGKFKRFISECITGLGSGAFVTPLMAYRTYYRTAGISDDSGSWTLIDQTGDMSAAAGTSSIQFKLEFQALGNVHGIPARVLSLGVLYEDLTTDSHYQPSVANSSTSNKQFAWRFSTAFGGTVPTLRIRLFDAVSGGSLVDDTTVGSTGTWEKSTDGGSNWVAYNTTDKANETTYIRYTPASLGDNIKVRALLTQN
jgi:hypothetical protein